jgi:hypothetical protein
MDEPNFELLCIVPDYRGSFYAGSMGDRKLPRGLMYMQTSTRLRGKCRLNSRCNDKPKRASGAIQVSHSLLRALLIDFAVHMYSH